MSHVSPDNKAYSELQIKKLEALEKKFEAAQWEIAQLDSKLHAPLYKERSQIVKDIPGFWLQVFINCISTSIYFDDSDHPAFSHLTDLEVEKDSKDLRSLTLTFHFSPNEYFNNSTLVKTFKPSPGAPKFPEYEVAEDSENEIVKLDWKNDEKNLCKLNPTKGDPDNEDFEPGSFFSTFFESKASTAAGIAAVIADELYPNALDIYTGTYQPEGFGGFEGLEEDDDDDDDDGDEDPNAEVDLEEGPAKKKTKTE